jgi:hypothetical protein
MGVFRTLARLSGGAALVSLGAIEARADSPPSTELSWSAPASCPGEVEVRAEVERYLGQTLAARRDQKIRIDASMREDERSGFVLSLRVTSAHGVQKRELSNTDCRKLGEAGALVIALAIDPKLVVPPPVDAPTATPAESSPAPGGTPIAIEALPAPQPPPNAPEPTPSVAVAGPSSKRDEPAAPTPSSHPSSWRVSAAGVGLVSGGPLPGVALGAGARLSAAMGRFQILVHGAYLFPKVEPVPMSSSARIELDLFRAGVGFCALPLAGTLTLTACLGPAFGSMRGSGEDLENKRTEHDQWSAFLAELTLTRVWNGGLLGMVGIEGGPAIDAPRFGITVNGEQVEIYQASGWVLSGSLGLGFSN